MKRKNSWSNEEDALLVEIVLNHIREGSTQLKAFEEAGERLNRTASACGFRWNAFLRKQHRSAMQIANEERLQLKNKTSGKKRAITKSESSHTLSYDDVIRFLRKQRSEVKQYHRLCNQIVEKDEEIQRLQAENEQLRKELIHHEHQHEAMNEDYKTIVQIMERARKMVVFEDAQPDEEIKFTMDRNGNIERLVR